MKIDNVSKVNVKIISNFEKEGCTFDKEIWCLEEKKKTIVHNYFEHDSLTKVIHFFVI
jgi:hypothetical protein